MTIKIKYDCLYFPICFTNRDIDKVTEYPDFFNIEFGLCSNYEAYESQESIEKDTMTANEIEEFRKWCRCNGIKIEQKGSI